MSIPAHTARLAWACVALAALAAFAQCKQAQAESMWTTYHRDAQRTGYDPDGVQPLPPSLAWQTEDLGAPIWSQPLVLGERVYVATVGDELYALEASSGAVAWKTSLGTPVPASELPCGDIEPTVGVVGTPVIDTAKDTIYAVADTWDEAAKEAHHVLYGLSLANGEVVLSTPVDPPGADPKAILQRTAANLDGDQVIFGYGGNDGDCSNYRGTVVAAPISGGPPRFWQYQPAAPSSSGGAVWATAGPSVDAAGDVYATTGNPNPPAGQTASTFDYSDSVVKLDPALDFVARPYTEAAPPLGWFEPPNWEEESNNDLDLSSAAAELLPGGLLFQAGKDGVGYLVDETAMEGGADAVYEHEVCDGHGSFGGDAFAGGTLYIPCTNGTQALAYDEQSCTFAPLWQGPSDAFGPPIVSAGLVWTVATGAFGGGGTKLYGLDPSTGTPLYTETLPSPVIDHFASPSAAGGRLFLATGTSVTAYQIAELSDGAPAIPEASPTPAPCVAARQSTEKTPGSSETPGGGSSQSPSAPPPSTPAPAKRAKPRRAPSLLHTRLRASGKGRVQLKLRCPGDSAPCRGTIVLSASFERATTKSARGGGHRTTIELARTSFGPSNGDFAVVLRLGKRALAILRAHGDRLAVSLRISGPGRPARRLPAVLR